MKFYLFVLFLFGGAALAFYVLLFKSVAEFAEARPQIAKEAVERYQAAAAVQNPSGNSRTAAQATLFSNKNIWANLTSQPEVSPYEEAAFENFKIPEGEFRCSKAQFELISSPPRCVFTNACFQCQNSGMIQPEIEDAHPFCADGTKANLSTIECCPLTTNEGPKCPLLSDCLQHQVGANSNCAL